MAFPRRSSRTPRSRFTLGLLLLTAVTLLALDIPGTGPLDPVRGALAAVFRPIRSAGDAAFEPISNGWKGAFGYGDVKDENDRLKAENDELVNQDAQIEALQSQIEQLEKLNDIDDGDTEAIAARVTTGPIGTFDRSVEIDVGEDDGVVEGMPVMTEGGVLGRIDEVKSGSSTVELLTETSSSIGIRLGNGELGYVQGHGPDEPLSLVMSQDTAALEVAEGDVVSTSGIDKTAFPGSLLVGTVSKVVPGADGEVPTFEVEPAADLSLVYVKVILRKPPS